MTRAEREMKDLRYDLLELRGESINAQAHGTLQKLRLREKSRRAFFSLTHALNVHLMPLLLQQVLQCIDTSPQN